MSFGRFAMSLHDKTRQGKARQGFRFWVHVNQKVCDEPAQQGKATQHNRNKHNTTRQHTTQHSTTPQHSTTNHTTQHNAQHKI
jgi:hypothetical protein